MADKQKTLKEVVKLAGIGLHTGEKVNMETMEQKQLTGSQAGSGGWMNDE